MKHIVSAGIDLQPILDIALPGDVISLEAGAAFPGTVALKDKAGDQPIIIESSRIDEIPPGERVSPALAGLMPKVLTVDSQPALVTTPGAHHYQLSGVELAPASSTFLYDVVAIGDPSSQQNSLEKIPHHITIDRSYIHAFGDFPAIRGLDLNADHAAVTNSHISGFKSAQNADTQAILIFNANGPFLIENNYLEAAGENFIAGGADAKILNMVPSDLTFRRNHLTKPLAWRGVWGCKNLFELKNARRVTIDDNLMEYSWASGQAGYAVVFTPRNQEGGNPWATIEDVMVTNNTIRHAASGFQLLGHDNLFPSQTMKRITIRNNLLEDIHSSWAPGLANKLFLMIDGAEDVTIERNTAKGDAPAFAFSGAPQFQRLIVTENVFESGTIASSEGNGSMALDLYAPNAVFSKNLMAQVFRSDLYPLDNTYVETLPSPLPPDVGYSGTPIVPTPPPVSPSLSASASPSPSLSASFSPSPSMSPSASASPSDSGLPEYRIESIGKNNEGNRTILYQQMFDEGYAAWSETDLDTKGNKMKFRRF